MIEYNNIDNYQYWKWDLKEWTIHCLLYFVWYFFPNDKYGNHFVGWTIFFISNYIYIPGVTRTYLHICKSRVTMKNYESYWERVYWEVKLYTGHTEFNDIYQKKAFRWDQLIMNQKSSFLFTLTETYFPSIWSRKIVIMITICNV